MEIRDQHLSTAGAIARRAARGRITASTSLTNVPFFRFKPRHGFILLDAEVHATSVTAAITVDLRLVGSEDVLSQPTIAIDATAEKWKTTTTFYALANGVFLARTALTAQVFTAAHVIAANKYGVILLQVDSAGAFSTKVSAATQSFDSAALALAALPAADAGKTAFGYIAIANNAGAWTANTDDLTNGSDVTTATFTALPITAPSALTGAITPLAGTRVQGVLESAYSKIRDRTGAKEILGLYTTDGSGAISNGDLTVGYRPFPIHGEQY